MRVVIYVSFALIFHDLLSVHSLAFKQLPSPDSKRSLSLKDQTLGRSLSVCQRAMDFALDKLKMFKSFDLSRSRALSRATSVRKTPSPTKTKTPQPAPPQEFNDFRVQQEATLELEDIKPESRQHIEYESQPYPAVFEEYERRLCHKDCLKRFGYVINKNGHAVAMMEGDITWRVTYWLNRCYCKPSESFASLLQAERIAVWRFELIRKVSLTRALNYLKDNGGIEHVTYDAMFCNLLTEELKRQKMPFCWNDSYTQWVDKLNDDYARGMPWPQSPVIG